MDIEKGNESAGEGNKDPDNDEKGEDLKETKNKRKKSKSKSKSKDKKKYTRKKKTKKSQKESEEEGEDGIEGDNISSKKMDLEEEGKDKWEGIKVFKPDVQNYFKDAKYPSSVNDFIKHLNEGKNYTNQDFLAWANRAHYLFVRMGRMHINYESFLRDLHTIEKIPQLCYYRIAVYYFYSKKNEQKYVTYFHVYFRPQFRIRTSTLKDWVLIQDINPKQIDQIMLGKFGNQQIFELQIRLFDIAKLHMTDKAFMEALNYKALYAVENEARKYEIIDKLPPIDDEEEEEKDEGEND